MKHEDKRTCARNTGALIIEVCLKKRQHMRRSKLETYVDILKVLAHWGPLKITNVMYKTNLNCSVLETQRGVLTSFSPTFREKVYSC